MLAWCSLTAAKPPSVKDTRFFMPEGHWLEQPRVVAAGWQRGPD